MNHWTSYFMNIDKSDTNIAMFGAFYVRVKEVLLKPFLPISATFVKLADIPINAAVSQAASPF